MKKVRSNIRVFYKDALHEILMNNKIPLSYKIWSFLSGFFPARAWFHGIDKKNKKKYLRDIDYYKNAPYNDVRYAWKIDKNNFKDTLCQFNEFLPKYYIKILDGKCEKLWDYPDKLEYTGIDSLFSLLEKEKTLAIKKIAGRAGEGFIVAKKLDGEQFMFNDSVYNYEKAHEYVCTLDGYLITEFIEQSDIYKNIWDKTTHTLRVQTYKKDENSKVQLVFAFVRVGTSKALRAVGHVCSDSCYSTNIDIDTGKPTATIIMGDDGRMKFVEKHEETGKSLQIAIPNWELIKGKCIQMHNKLEKLTWLGWDIVVTNNGFKILEINTFSGLVAPEAFEPIKESKRYQTIFDELFNIKKQSK